MAETSSRDRQREPLHDEIASLFVGLADEPERRIAELQALKRAFDEVWSAAADEHRA
ncbi:MAG: hypothetical protein KF841_15195 [Phycisphaerae bacterium]|nr:hypothetical protein [Phycisphaerae bacterium]